MPVLIKQQEKSSEFLQEDVAITQGSAQHTADNGWWFLSPANRQQFILASTWVSLVDYVSPMKVQNPVQNVCGVLTMIWG